MYWCITRFTSKIKSPGYFRILLDEHLDFNSRANTLARAAAKTLCGVISKFKSFKNVGFKTFSKQWGCTIMDYCSGIWGFESQDSGDKIKQRALRYYLGVYSKVSILAIGRGGILGGWISYYYYTMELYTMKPDQYNHLFDN